MQQLQNEETEADLDLEDVDDSDFEDYIEEYGIFFIISLLKATIKYFI